MSDNLESLTSCERKLRQQIEQRAKILNVKIDNEESYGELTNDKTFTEHLNLSHLVASNFNSKLVNQSYKEFDVQSVKANVTKVKLIRDVCKALECHPLELDATGDGQVNVKDAAMICKVFRFKELADTEYNTVHKMMVKMVKQVAPATLFTSKRVKRPARAYIWSIDSEILTKHLTLIHKRSPDMVHVDTAIMDMVDFKPVRFN